MHPCVLQTLLCVMVYIIFVIETTTNGARYGDDGFTGSIG